MSETPGIYQTSAYEAMRKYQAANPLVSQIGGSHYKDMKIQPTEFILANSLGFCEGNVLKYVCRHGTKNGKEDLLKAKHYIDLLIAAKYPG